MYSYVGDQHLCVFQDAPGFAGDHVPQVVVDPPTSSNPNFNHIPPGKSPKNNWKTMLIALVICIFVVTRLGV